MMTAFITGVSGQDGSYLAEFLLNKGYTVHGLIRRSSSINTARLDHIFEHEKFHLHYGDLSDASSLAKLLHKTQPAEVFHLGAQSHVAVSFQAPEYTVDIGAGGTIRLLEAIRAVNPKIRFYNAASSEMFGLVQEIPQTEKTPFYPRSPYGAAKVCSFWLTRNYRESYEMHCSNGILFNHESPRRGPTFVTRKITRAVARIKAGLQDELRLGNLDARRDWGFAGDYVEAMWLLLQQPVPDDYVIATGEQYSVKDFLEIAFSYVGLNWREFVVIDQKYFRPAEVDTLLGDSSKARRVLGWSPKTSFGDLVKMMVDHDIYELSR